MKYHRHQRESVEMPRSSARRGVKAKRRDVVRLACLENLEGRRLMSGVTATLTSGVLTVQGTPNNDVISVSVSGSNINVDDTNVLVNSFATSSVQSVVVLGGAGNDSITIGAGVPPANVNGGAGADTIVANNGHDSIQGGKGPDNLSVNGAHNQVAGDKGSDILDAKGHDNFLSGGPGMDLLIDQTSGSGDTVEGNGGSNDIAEGFAADDLETGVESTIAPGTIDSFDITGNTSGTPTSTQVTFIPSNAFNYNPTVPNVRADYGAATLTPVLSTQNSTLTNPFQGATSGSVELPGTFNVSANGSNNTMAYTFDLYPNAETFSTISFDIMVDPSSVTDAFGGYGYLGILTRDGNMYTSHNVTEIDDASVANGFELGTGSGPVPTAGQWYHVTAQLDASPDDNNSVRAITIQDYGGSGQNLTGNVTLYIDNLALGS